jgi:drug/metabolite transporter (DMT)-like permease
VVCAFGYLGGGRLAAVLPGWQVIAWAFVLALPITGPMTALAVANEPMPPDGIDVFGLTYVWYRGMADLRVTHASQLKLAQPPLSLIWSVILLCEHLPPLAPVTAVVVLLCITVTQPDPTYCARRVKRNRVALCRLSSSVNRTGPPGKLIQR